MLTVVVAAALVILAALGGWLLLENRSAEVGDSSEVINSPLTQEVTPWRASVLEAIDAYQDALNAGFGLETRVTDDFTYYGSEIAWSLNEDGVDRDLFIEVHTWSGSESQRWIETSVGDPVFSGNFVVTIPTQKSWVGSENDLPLLRDGANRYTVRAEEVPMGFRVSQVVWMDDSEWY